MEYTLDQIAELQDARRAQLLKQGKTPRNATETASMEWAAHTGHISKEALKGWKDPYPALEKAAKAKPKTTVKAKKK